MCIRDSDYSDVISDRSLCSAQSGGVRRIVSSAKKKTPYTSAKVLFVGLILKILLSDEEVS